MNRMNRTVNVNAFYFNGRQQLRAYPRQMELGNTQYTFNDGLQYLIRKGKRVIQLFDMTDGTTTFRLKCEDDQWTLIGTKAVA